MQAIIEGNLYEIEPAVKVILDRVMTENAELKRENKRLEELYQKSIGVIAATDCAECKEYIDDVNSAIDCIKHFCQKQRSCVDCPIYAGNEYYTCLFRDGIAPAHWGNVEIINCNEEASGGAENETD